MSQNQGQFVDQSNTANNQTQENSQQVVQEDYSQLPQKTLMFYQADMPNANGVFELVWMIDPNYYGYFCGMLEMLADLADTIDKKWKEEEVNAYLKYIEDIESYIGTNILGRQVQVWYYEDFEQTLLNYGQNVNPLGFQLYLKQLDFKQRQAEGNLYQKNPKSKDPNNQKQEIKRVIAEKKEEVLVRASDPEINIQKLMTTEWDQTKYLNTQVFNKENANLVFIGHVDSGKSTLTGKILKGLNEVDEQELMRIKKDAKDNKMETWEDAGVSDIIPEEQKDGKTREYAKLNFSLAKKRFTLFDAPGHKNYVPNMIMGACQADIAVLIISAKEGEFESGFEKDGQTKEHAMLAKALGVHELIVTVTKMGTVDWSQKRFSSIKQLVTPFLENACGFKNVVFIPVESLLNMNIHSRIQNSWYKGPALLEFLDDVKLPARTPNGPLRMPIIDKFKDVGNLYIYGKIESGTVIEDHTVTLLPSRKQMLLKEIFNAKDQKMPFAMAGENVKIRVKMIEENEISRGDMVCNNLNYCQQSSQFKANVTILELPDNKKILASGYECVIHMHAIVQNAEIIKVDCKFDSNHKKVPATFLKIGQTGTLVVKIESPICLQKFEFMPSLGRFTLRDEGKTIGYGEIIGLKPAKTLLKEQKEQLVGEKKEVSELEAKISSLKIEKSEN